MMANFKVHYGSYHFRHLTFILVFTTISCLIQHTNAIVINRDTCTVDLHCLNGGTCQPSDDESPYRHCHCQDGYAGTRCSDFCPLQCQNGGYCHAKPQRSAGPLQSKWEINDPDNFVCKCFGLYTGLLCEIPYTNCGNRERCYNGGTCKKDIDPTQRGCICPAEYTGQFCHQPSQMQVYQQQQEEQGQETSPMPSEQQEQQSTSEVISSQRTPSESNGPENSDSTRNPNDSLSSSTTPSNTQTNNSTTTTPTATEENINSSFQNETHNKKKKKPRGLVTALFVVMSIAITSSFAMLLLNMIKRRNMRLYIQQRVDANLRACNITPLEDDYEAYSSSQGLSSSRENLSLI